MGISSRYLCSSKSTISSSRLAKLASRIVLLLILSIVLIPALRAQNPDSGAGPQASDASAAAQVKLDHAWWKKKSPDKYDVDHIGRRGIGGGVNMYSLERERKLGESMARNIDLHTKFVSDPLVTDYVNQLGQKIVRNSDCLVPFTIKVIDSQDIRVFSLPGGFLYVDSGLVMASDTEAELAGVMAQEIAHVAARHGTRAATRTFMWDVMASLSYLGGPVGIGVQNIGGIGFPLSLKKFSRDAVAEADLLGIEYAYASGYDPEAYVTALEKLHVMESRMHKLKTKIPLYNFFARLPFHSRIARGFSSYPLTEERIRNVQAEIASLLPGKQEYISDTSDFQQVKAKLAHDQGPVLRRHRKGENNANGPVLRRNRAD
jgi:beta-barrel assembly-enhancing protease